VILLDPALAEGLFFTMLGALPDFEPSGDGAAAVTQLATRLEPRQLQPVSAGVVGIPSIGLQSQMLGK
jgi:hypothetical protein